MAEEKSPILATGLSLLIPGAGQLYLGETNKGIILFVAASVLWLIVLGVLVFGGTIVSGLVAALVSLILPCCCFVGLVGYLPFLLLAIFPLIVHAYAAYDAYAVASALAKKE